MFSGFQGFRSPTLFLHVIEFILHSFIQKQLCAYSRMQKQMDSTLQSSLFRNGLKKPFANQIVNDLLNGNTYYDYLEEEMKLPLLNDQLNEIGDELLSQYPITETEEIEGCQYQLDLPMTDLEKELQKKACLPSLLSHSNPNHQSILSIFRVLMCVMAYHTDQLPLLVPVSQKPEGISEDTISFYKKGGRLLMKVNTLRTRKNLLWGDLNFIHSYFFLIKGINPSCLDWDECEQVTIRSVCDIGFVTAHRGCSGSYILF